MSVCAGIDCEVKLPPARGGRPRKWCSKRCRKATYGDPCVDCGARTAFGAEAARVPEPRCGGCRRRRNADRRVSSVLAMVELRREGLTNPEIASELDTSVLTVATELCRMRVLGFDFPASPYHSYTGELLRRPGGPAFIDHAVITLARALEERGHAVPTSPEPACNGAAA